MNQSILTRLVGLLPPVLRPYAKAILPAAATGVTVLAHWIVTGEFNADELKIAVEGAALSLVAFLFPNLER
jgi:uncharacterized membrane protein (GlpM family)